MASTKSKITISQDLRDDLKKYGNLYCVGMASKIADDLMDEAAYAFQEFYKDYDPISYKRYEKNFVREHKSYKRYMDNHGKGTVKGGIELDPSWMTDVYEESKEAVFYDVLLGYHGVWNNIDVMSPNPLEILANRRDEILDNIQGYRKYGYHRAKSQSYITLTSK